MNEKLKAMKELDDQVFYDREKVWRVSRLLALSHDLEVMEIPLKHMQIYNFYPIIKNTMDFIDHVRRVNEADLSCPIILDDEGFIMDGRHRLAKSLLIKAETIKAVRFDKTPEHDYTREYTEVK